MIVINDNTPSKPRSEGVSTISDSRLLGVLEFTI